MVDVGMQEPHFVLTGQHYDWELARSFMKDLDLPDPDVNLGIGSGTHAHQTAETMLRLEPILVKEEPRCVVVVGDVNSTLGAALTAVKMNLPVAHVEAGLRSHDRTMPEEVNRVLTDAISDILFAPSEDAVANLVKEGRPQKCIHMVGNVMIDSLDAVLSGAVRLDVGSRWGLERGQYLVATLHRPSNVDRPGHLRNALEILAAASRLLRTALVAHPRTRARLEEAGLDYYFEREELLVIDPLPYPEFLSLVEASAGVLTDSGGIQEETTVLGIPCMTMRDATERPITVEQGSNRLVGLDIDLTMSLVQEIVGGWRPEPKRPLNWDGHSAERIAHVLHKHFS